MFSVVFILVPKFMFRFIESSCSYYMWISKLQNCGIIKWKMLFII